MRTPSEPLILMRACGAIALALFVASCATPLAVTDQRNTHGNADIAANDRMSADFHRPGDRPGGRPA